MKYIIEITPGTYVEKFFGASVCITRNIKSARGYTKSIANKRISKNGFVNAQLIPISTK